MGRIVYTDPSGQEFNVVLSAEAPVVTIGRATDCSIRSNRKSVSRHHAEFRYSNGRFEVVDLDSANGTYLIINSERRPVHGRQFISHGDEVWCGDFILHFYEEQTQASQPSHFGVSSGRPSGGAPSSMSQGFGAKYEFAEQDMGAHGSEFGSFNANFDADAASYGEYEELLADEFSEVQDLGHGDFERLRSEKRSIEELAAKQAFEVVELRIEISERDQKIDQLSQAVSTLEASQGDHAELKKAAAHATRLEKKLNAALAQIQQLEALPSSAGADPSELAELRDSVSAKELDISDLQNRLDDSISQLNLAAERAAKAEQSAASALEELRKVSSNGAADEVDGLRNELERQGRLMTQFERRSRELQLELDHERSIATSLREMAALHESLVSELTVVTRERDDAIVNYSKLTEEIAKVESNAEHTKNSVRDLKGEIQGLKRLLQMERERSRDDKALAEVSDGLQQQIASLSQELEDLQSTYQQQQAELHKSQQELQIATLAAGISPQYFEDMREQIDTLDRIVDALERADLKLLNTVDRIRLQSAVRDSSPREILQEMRRMTIEIVAKDEEDEEQEEENS